MQRIAFAVLFVLVTTTAFAQNAPSRGFIDVNVIGIQSSQGESVVTKTDIVAQETRTAVVAYPEISGTGRTIEIGGGFRLFGAVGVGVHFDSLNIEQTAGLAITVPHPTLFNRAATGTATSDVLERQDRNIDFMVMYFAPTPDALSVRVWAGPTYFKVEEERVNAIQYNQVFNLLGANSITITSAPTSIVDGSSWGLNVGGDVAYFFSRYVGVGGTVRFNKGTVTLTDPFTNADAEREASHVSFGGGLRLRF